MTSLPQYHSVLLFSMHKKKLALIISLSLGTLCFDVQAGNLNGPTAEATVDSMSPREQWTLTNGATLNVTSGGHTNAINASNKSIVNIDGGTVNDPMGSRGVSLGSGSIGTISNSTITSTNSTALQIISDLGAVMDDRVSATVSSTAITGNNIGAGVIIADASFDRTRIVSTGTTGYGMVLEAGNATLSNGSSVTGQRYGIRVRSANDVDHNSTLIVDNSTITGVNDSAIYVDGLSLDPTLVDITISNGSSLVGGNGTMLEVVEGATANITMDNSDLTGNIVVDGASASSVILQNASSMTGNVVAESGGMADVSLLSGATLTGQLDNVNNLSIGNAARYIMTADSNVGIMTLNDGSVSFGDATVGYKTLTVDTLDGSGSFSMNTDVSAQLADLLNVTNTANGSFTLKIANSGSEPVESSDQLELVRTGGGTAAFAVTGGKVDIGTWQYGLVKSGDNWYLVQDGKIVKPVDPTDPGTPTDPTDPTDPGTPTDPTDPTDPGNSEGPAPTTTPSADALLNIASAPQFMFYGELENLRSRRVALQGALHQGGVWGSFLYNGDNVTGAHSSSYKLAQSGLQLGADSVHQTTWGDLVTGLFVSSSSGKVKNTRGGTSDIDSWGLGLYASLFNSKGFYVNTTVKGNRFSNDLSTSMSDGTAVKGNWHQYGYGGDIEAGWRIALPLESWVQPYARLSGYQGQSKTVTLSNGMQADLGKGKSVRGETGVSAGKDFTPGSMIVTPYISAAVLQEFVDNNNVRINNAYDFNNDFSGTSGRFGAGVSVAVSKNALIYAETSYLKGHNVESPVNGNLGVNIKF